MILPRGLAVLRFGTYRTSRHTYFYQVNRNLLQSSTSVPHTCILKFARLKSYKRNANKDLLPFRMINDCDDKKLNDDTFEKSVIDLHDKFHILLNPAKHADILNAPQNTAPSDSQSLQVSVVGIPNAGKSTLVNQLMGNNICAHSEKVHTTRQNALGILTKDSKQIIFQVSSFIKELKACFFPSVNSTSLVFCVILVYIVQCIYYRTPLVLYAKRKKQNLVWRSLFYLTRTNHV